MGGAGKKKEGRKTQIIAIVIVVVICVAFAIYSFVWGRGYFNNP
jgi:flagellar basal body-associated protein FliL